MARSPLSKKKTIPRNENNTPNPVNPSPISVSFETQGLEKVSTFDQCWNIWKEGEKSICHSLQSTPINYAHSIDSGKVKQSRWPKRPHKLIQHACRIENRAQKIYSTLWAPKPVNMVVRCMLWDPQWSWLHHYLRSFEAYTSRLTSGWCILKMNWGSSLKLLQTFKAYTIRLA